MKTNALQVTEMTTKSFVTVIVPTYADWERLALCIEALREQTYPQNYFEVLIVDNNPDDVAPEHLKLPQNFTLIRETKPGSYAARNTGLRLAKGSIIGFTDSDCIPDKNWIENAIAFLELNKGCSRVAGSIQLFSSAPRSTVSELYDRIYSFQQKEYVKTGGCATANLFAYKYLFDTVGLFDERLMSNGDLEWGRAASKAGFKICYVENVIIKHPARNLPALIKKELRKGGGRGMAEREWNNKLTNFFRIVNGLRPRLTEIKFINQTPDLSTIEKIKVLLLRHYLLYLRALEHLRVQLGKTPNRA
jgi:glycosyltransferase involved in cell wall biosynthesis